MAVRVTHKSGTSRTSEELFLFSNGADWGVSAHRQVNKKPLEQSDGLEHPLHTHIHSMDI